MTKSFIEDAKARAAQKVEATAETHAVNVGADKQAVENFKKGVAEEVGIIEPLLRDIAADLVANGHEAKVTEGGSVSGSIAANYHYDLRITFKQGVAATVSRAIYVVRLWPYKGTVLVEVLKAESSHGSLHDVFNRSTLKTLPDLEGGISELYGRLLDAVFSVK
jgi:hypothetical protein